VVGSEEELEFVCGERLAGRMVGVEAPCGVGEGFCDLRLELPTRFLKRLLMDDIDEREKEESRREAG